MEYPDPALGLNAKLACMAVGDPDSNLDEAAKNMVAASMLQNMQEDPEAAEQWELVRHQMNADDERTVHDFTVADVRHMCELIFQAIEAGAIPNPLSEIEETLSGVLGLGAPAHTNWLPDHEPNKAEQDKWAGLADNMLDRLFAAGILGPDHDVRADAYVAVHMLVTATAQRLDVFHYHAEAEHLRETAEILSRLFILIERARNTFN